MSNYLNPHTFSSYFNPFDKSFDQLSNRFSELESKDKILIIFLTVLAAPLLVLPGVAVFRYLTEEKVKVLDAKKIEKNTTTSKVQDVSSEIVKSKFIIQMEQYVEEKCKKDGKNDINIEEAKVEFIKNKFEKTIDYEGLIIGFEQANITNEEKRFEIAEILAKNFLSVDALSKNIQKFRLSEENRFKIAKILAKSSSSGKALSENIEKFGLSEDKRFEITKIFIEDPSKTSFMIENIEKFGLSEENSFKIAEILAKSLLSPEALPKNIEKFGLSEENSFKIAEILAKSLLSPEALSKNIEKFGLSEDKRFEIAKIFIKDPLKTSFMIKNIEKFAPLEPTRFKIVELIMNMNLGKTNRYFDDVKPWIVKFRDFKLPEDSRLKIFNELLKSYINLESLYENIDKFEFSEDERLKIVYKIVESNKNLEALVKYLEKFDLSQDQLVEIARIIINSDVINKSDKGISLLVENIQKFRLPKEFRLEILNLLLETPNNQSVQYVYKNIQNFEIEDDRFRYDIFTKCLKYSYQTIDNLVNFLPFSHLPVLNEYFLEIINKFRIEYGKEFDISNIKSLIEKGPYSDLMKKKLLGQWDNLHDNRNSIKEHDLAFNLIAFLSLNDKQQDWTVETGFFDAILKSPFPSLKKDLVQDLVKLSKESKLRDFWSDIKLNPKKINSMELLILPFSRLQAEGVDEFPLKNILNVLIQRSKKNSSLIKDGTKNRVILEVTYLIGSNQEMSANEKSLILEKIFEKDNKGVLEKIFIKNEKGTEEDYKALIEHDRQWLKNVAAYKGLVNCNTSKEDLLNQPLQKLFIDTFRQILPLKDFKGDFIESYEKIFGSSRHPDGLIKYAMGLKSLDNEAVISCLEKFVNSVFNEDFIQNRYSTEHNSHLKLIEKKAPEVFEKWKLNYSVTYENESESENKLNVEDWLKTKLIEDKHLGEMNVSYLRDYFKGNKELSNVIDELRTQLKNKKNLDSKLVNSYQIQLSCLELVKNGLNGKNLEDIKKLLNESIEFKNDVEGLLKQLSQKKKDLKQIKAVTTDDPLDLFFSGTDVAGSCQRLDGSPSLNRGLLGYLMDGKIRLLAVKGERGKILSRALLRILWDEENQKPVLYLDRFYPYELSENEKTALTQLAKKIGEDLSLTVTQEEGSLPYENTLESLAGPAPYEYVDGAGGIRNDGKYVIRQAFVI